MSHSVARALAVGCRWSRHASTASSQAATSATSAAAAGAGAATAQATSAAGTAAHAQVAMPPPSSSPPSSVLDLPPWPPVPPKRSPRTGRQATSRKPKTAAETHLNLRRLGPDVWSLLEPVVQAHTPEARSAATQHLFHQLTRAHMSDLSPASLQYLLVTLFIADKCPTAMTHGRLRVHHTATRVCEIDKFARVKTRGKPISWAGTSQSDTMMPDDPLPQLLMRLIEEVDSTIISAKSRPADDLRSAHSAAGFLFRLLHALRQSHLLDHLAFSDVRNDIGGGTLGGRSARQFIHSRVAVIRAPMVAPESVSLQEKLQSAYVPIVVGEMMDIIQRHIDVFCFPVTEETEANAWYAPPRSPAEQAAWDQRETATPQPTMDPIGDRAEQGADENSEDITADDERGMVEKDIDHAESDELALEIALDASPNTVDAPVPPAAEADPSPPPFQPTPFEDETAIRLDSSHALPSSPFPSLTSPVSNLVRLLSLVHSFRHLFAAGKLVRLCMQVAMLERTSASLVRAHRSNEAHRIVQSVSNATAISYSSREHAAARVAANPDAPRAIITEPGGVAQAPPVTDKSRFQPRACYIRDIFIWSASLPDVIYLYQLLAIHQKQAGGLSTAILAMRMYLRAHSAVMVQRCALVHLEQVLEVFGHLGIIGGDSLLQLFDRAADIAGLPTWKEINESTGEADHGAIMRILRSRLPKTTSDATVLPQLPFTFTAPSALPKRIYTSGLSQGEIQQAALDRKLSARFALMFRSVASCIIPSDKQWFTSRWSNFIWSKQPTIAHLHSPLRVARLIAVNYDMAFEHLTPTTTHEKLIRHLDEMTHFAWFLICLELEQHGWAAAFLQRLIRWFEATFPLQTNENEPDAPTRLVQPGPGKKELADSIVHRLHQIALALTLRSRTIAVEKATQATNSIPSEEATLAHLDGWRGEVASSTPIPFAPTFDFLSRKGQFISHDHPLVNFSAPVRTCLMHRWSISEPLISGFQMLVYQLLTDPDGPFAFRARRQDDEQEDPAGPVRDDPHAHPSQGRLAPEHDVTSTLTSTRADRPLELLIEYCSAVGYRIDAATFVKSSMRTRMFGIEVEGTYHYRAGSQYMLTNASRLRRKQLRLFGWHILAISHTEWNRQPEAHRPEWIMNQLPHALTHHMQQVKQQQQAKQQQAKQQVVHRDRAVSRTKQPVAFRSFAPRLSAASTVRGARDAGNNTNSHANTTTLDTTAPISEKKPLVSLASIALFPKLAKKAAAAAETSTGSHTDATTHRT